MSSDIATVSLISLNMYTTILDSIDHDGVYEEIKSHGNRVDDREKVSPEDCVTHYGDATFPFGRKNCEQLLLAIQSVVSSVAQNDMVLESIWSMTMEKNESVPFHSHKSNRHYFPMEYFSVAYYPKAPEGSSNFIAVAPFCGTIENNVKISPKPGLLVVFNSFVQHYTDRHKGDDPRVVVSANYAPQAPNVSRMPDWSVYDQRRKGSSSEG